MIKNKPVIILGVGILIALVVATVSYNYLQKKTAVQVQSVETQPLVVAAVDMPWGEVLSTSTVKVQPYLKATLPPGAFRRWDSSAMIRSHGCCSAHSANGARRTES